jgi:hypothetical protein
VEGRVETRMGWEVVGREDDGEERSHDCGV